MSLRVLNTNVSALQAERRLSHVSGQLRATFERLSSGMRINRASDDAAGLAIGTSLRSDSRVHSQAIRNVSDAISMYDIAEGASQELSSVLIRIRELASQSANGVLSNSQRGALDDEAQALRAEFNRIIAVTEFNGLNLLDGNVSTLSVQAGYSSIDLDFANLGTSVVGDGTFSARTSFAAGDEANAVTASDLNGDGNIDLVIASANDDRINVLIGNGDGTFSARRSYDGGNAPQQTQILDINGDGIFDLASVSGLDDSINIFIGVGDGTFQSRISFAAGDGSSQLSLGDANGDGNIDVISSSNTDNSVSVLFGNGNGTFQARISFYAGINVDAVVSADMNGDGILDIVTASPSSDKANVLIGNGNGTFQAYRSFAGGNGAGYVAVADIDGDGHLDIATASSNDAKINVLINNGNGTFYARLTFDGGVGASFVGLEDINEDGHIDMIAGAWDEDTVSFIYGNGDGTFNARVSYATGDRPGQVAIADLDNDGALDLTVTSFSEDGVNVHLGNGNVVAALSAFSLTTQSSALAAMNALDTALRNVSTARGAMGSSTSRLQVAQANLSTTRENYEAAASQIMDADVAQDAAELVRLRILQNAAASVLSQANQLPALALRLLGR